MPDIIEGLIIIVKFCFQFYQRATNRIHAELVDISILKLHHLLQAHQRHPHSEHLRMSAVVKEVAATEAVLGVVTAVVARVMTGPGAILGVVTAAVAIAMVGLGATADKQGHPIRPCLIMVKID